MNRKEEIELSKKIAAKKLTPEQLKMRKFCEKCLEYRGKRGFSYDSNSEDGRAKFCKSCAAKQRKKSDLKRKLLAKEIYVEGASKIVVDKVVAGRQLVSKASLAAFLGVHERTVIRLKNKGEITGYDFLGQTYFKKEEVEAWLEQKLGEKIELDNKYIS